MKETKINLLDRGDSFQYGGYGWTIIKRDGYKRYCLCDTLVFSGDVTDSNRYSNDYTMLNTSIPWEVQEDTGKYNPFRSFLTLDFLEHVIANGARYKDFYVMERDLAADDGTTPEYEHGITDIVTLLTADEYRKNRKYIKHIGNQDFPYLTITPHSYGDICAQHGWEAILPDGTIHSVVPSHPTTRSNFRPMICLSMGATVFVEDVSEE